METAAADDGRVLLIDKPLTWTSFDVVNKLRYRLKMKKIGHAGTLDPLATGLLIVCTGKKTKQIETFMGQEKEYTGAFVLGQTTASYDLETAPTQPPHDLSHLTLAHLTQAAQRLTGNIQQSPPAHSAIRIGGKRAYDLARKGQEVALAPRSVEVRAFDIESYQAPVVRFRIVCSKGTYIRSIARDFGETLGVGAYLSELCRTRIGAFHLKDAVAPDKVQDIAEPRS